MEKGSMCGKATKGIPTEGASVPCKGKSTGKKVEESGGRESSACDKAIRNATRVEKELSGRIKEESRGALQ